MKSSFSAMRVAIVRVLPFRFLIAVLTSATITACGGGGGLPEGNVNIDLNEGVITVDNGNSGPDDDASPEDNTNTSTVDSSEEQTDQNINVVPVANAGMDITVEVGESVQLDASNSYDPDGAIVSYSWNNGLVGSKPNQISYAAPGNYTVELSVEDNVGAIAYDVVVVNVVSKPVQLPQNLPPIFGCFDDIFVDAGDVVSLSTAGAYDPDGTIDNVQWSYGQSGINFTHIFNAPGTYEIIVSITDDDGAVETCSFTVIVNEIDEDLFYAHAGEDIQVRVNEVFQFNASLTAPNDGNLTFNWSNGLTGITPSHSYSEAGTYEVTLNVSNPLGLTDADIVVVTVTDFIPPVAIPTPPEEVCLGDQITLDASDSYDEDGTITSYVWNGPSFELIGNGALWTPTDAGTYTIHLLVMDNDNQTAGESFQLAVQDCSSNIVYVKNLYDAPNIHYFNVTPMANSTEWPGIAMEYDEELKLHFFEFDSEVQSAGIVFNAGVGQAQTEDLNFIAGNEVCFNGSTNTWQTVDACTQGGDPVPPIDFASRTAFVHLFEWQWDDVASECENYLGPKGFAAVQVSPPQKSIDGGAWWTRYQPIGYTIEGRSGNRDQFRSMVERCKAAGVDIYVDAVINHMAAWDKNYPEVPYSGNDFHDCPNAINYGDRGSIQFCDLSGLNDLKTESDYVRGRIAEYMNDMISLGVAGFRIDAAKHIPTDDIANIVGRLNGNPYIFQEVIGAPGEPITPDEFTFIGDVTEFRYTEAIGHFFKMRGALKELGGLGQTWSGWLNSNDAIVFVANHDNQRQDTNNRITHKDGWDVNNIAHVFMLGWPYGYPKVMSSYDWNDHDQGPPSHGASSCNGGWLCEHRNREIANMVGFRNFTNGEGVDNWWDNGSNQIAFGRGSKGFVVINGESGGTLSTTLQTGMPEGTYCDVMHADFNDGVCSGATITVDASGNASFNVDSKKASVIHVGARVE